MSRFRQRARLALFAPTFAFLALLALATNAAHATVFYVSSTASANIFVVDSTSNSVVAQIPTTGATLYVDVSAEGSRAVVLEPNASILHIINTATNADNPLQLAPYAETLVLSADGTTAYVGFQNVSGVAAHLSAINLNTRMVVNDVALATQSALGTWALGLTVDGTKLFSANYGSATVDVYDTTTLGTLASVAVPEAESSIAMSPTQPIAYVSGADGVVTSINTATYAVQSVAALGAYPQFVAVSPDGKSIYVVQSQQVVVIDSASNTVRATVPVTNGNDPRGLAFTPDGRFGYLAQYFNGVAVIDTLTNTISTSVSGVPGGIFIATNGIPVPPPPPPVTTPFAKYTPELLVAPKLSAYSVAASFTLAKGAKALAPMTENLTLTVGAFTVTVPAGSIKQPSPKIGLYTYSGTLNGAKFGLILTGQATGPWGIVAVGAHAFGSSTTAVPVTLTVGPNSGSTSIKPVVVQQVQSLN
ncbi:YncE family protein [Paraburkholderia fungorum]|uniref:YncE family protein n=1 Tax=Paraburkholderia fungorum TaxID=134537 RepID=UPI0038BA1307